MKRTGFIIAVWTIVLCINAQDIEVKKFEPLEKDQTAVTSPRKDINGNTCGLVKVVLKEQGLQFEGNIIGDVEIKGVEYYVYLSKGTKRLNIKHPNYLPITVTFSDYGVNKISSGHVYKLELKTERRKVNTSDKKGTIVLKVMPSDVDLYVNNELLPKERNGIYNLSLPIGSHFYSVKLGDFAINNRLIKVEKKAKVVDVDLTTFFSYLKVSCVTEGSVIYVNGVQKGINDWEGLVPPGEYTIDAKKDGFISMTRILNIQENDSVFVSMIGLKEISGKLNIQYQPDSCVIYIDGKRVGITPFFIEDISVGTHKVVVDKDCYYSFRKTIDIEEGQTYTIEGSLEYMSEFCKIKMEAIRGNADAQNKLARMYNNETFSSVEGWNKNDVNYETGIYWLEKAAAQNHPEALRSLAKYLEIGRGCRKDPKRAFALLKQSLDLELDLNACYWMGRYYRYGIGGVEKDLNIAAYWYRKAFLLSGGSFSRVEEELKEIGYEIK
ncbi:MAG: PEGA domain-containing protein [Prevotella sp.]|nr:PEGA domain-containing protein [Prevotella sp.]